MSTMELRFRFCQTCTSDATPKRAYLRQLIIDGTVYGKVDDDMQDEGEYKITFSQPGGVNGWNGKIQMLGTQFDLSSHYDTETEQARAQQVSFFYRLRTCTSTTLSNVCTGTNINDKLRELNPSRTFTITAASQTITLNMATTDFTCQLFEPFFGFMHDYGSRRLSNGTPDPTDITLTPTLSSTALSILVVTSDTIAAGTKVRVHVFIQ